MNKKAALVLLVIILPLAPLKADDSSFWDSTSWAVLGSLFYFAADNGIDSDHIPIRPSLGFSFAWQFWGPLKVEFTEDIYFTNYEYNFKRGYPMACTLDSRSGFVLGLVTAINLTAAFNIGDNDITARVYGGPAADFRIVTWAFGLNHTDFTGDERDAGIQAKAISDYFWGNGRWFMPAAGFGIDFPLNDSFLLGFDLRTWFPVYKLWTNDDTPAIDGWRFGAGLRITPRARSSNRNDSNRDENNNRDFNESD